MGWKQLKALPGMRSRLFGECSQLSFWDLGSVLDEWAMAEVDVDSSEPPELWTAGFAHFAVLVGGLRPVVVPGEILFALLEIGSKIAVLYLDPRGPCYFQGFPFSQAHPGLRLVPGLSVVGRGVGQDCRPGFRLLGFSFPIATNVLAGIRFLVRRSS